MTVVETPGQACSIRGCIRPADVFDPDGRFAYCFDHCEQIIERWAAIALNPRMLESLPEIPHR
jgi:hypothetical protein